MLTAPNSPLDGKTPEQGAGRENHGADDHSNERSALRDLVSLLPFTTTAAFGTTTCVKNCKEHEDDGHNHHNGRIEADAGHVFSG